MNASNATSADTLYSLIYVSSACVPFSTADLTTLLTISRRNNLSCGITGMLLYKAGNFMQALEGPRESIERTHERIFRDPRHTGLITLLERPIAERQFDGWSMGFQNLSDEELHDVPGYSDFLNLGLTSAEFAPSPSRAHKLLQNFRQKM